LVPWSGHVLFAEFGNLILIFSLIIGTENESC
jgi:hypothetical protein